MTSCSISERKRQVMRKRPAAFKFLALRYRSNRCHRGPKEKSTDARALLGDFARRSRNHDPIFPKSLLLKPLHVNVRKSVTRLVAVLFIRCTSPENVPSDHLFEGLPINYCLSLILAQERPQFSLTYICQNLIVTDAIRSPTGNV